MSERDHRKGPSKLELAAICIYVILVTALLIRHMPEQVRQARHMVRSGLGIGAAVQQSEPSQSPSNNSP